MAFLLLKIKRKNFPKGGAVCGYPDGMIIYGMI